MSQSFVNKYEVPTSAPPPYEDNPNGGIKSPKEAQKPSLPPGVPVMIPVPLALNDVGRGNVVYVVNNQNGRSEPIDSNLPFGRSFEDKAIRAVFVRKVYATLMLQLLTTVIFIAWFMFHAPTRHFVQRNTVLLIIAYVTFLVTYIILVCCTTVRRTWPCNFIMLSIFTLSMSYWAAAISAFHDTYIVFMTVGIVTVVCLGITIFSIQTKWDITGKGVYLFVFFLVVFLFGIIATVVTFTTGSRIMSVVYAGLLALVFALYLVYNTQQIIGGRKVELSAEEHIFGALQLYIYIIQLYLVLLTLGNNSCK